MMTMDGLRWRIDISKNIIFDLRNVKNCGYESVVVYLL